MLAGIFQQLERATGKKFSMRTVHQWTKAHEAVYLLGASGYTPVKKTYYPTFREYIGGPYSRLLSSDFDAISVKGIAPGRINQIPSEVADFINGALSRGSDFTLAVTTILMTSEVNCTTKKETILHVVSDVEPKLKPILEEAWTYLRKHRLPRKCTSTR